MDQLGGGLVVREVTARFDDLAQRHVQAFDGVGGVDNFAHVGGVSEAGNDFFPMPAPAGGNGRVFSSPGAGIEGIERGAFGLGIVCPVDGFELGGEALAVLPVCLGETRADQVHEAGKRSFLSWC